MIRNVLLGLAILLACWFAADAANAADLNLPQQITAGTDLSITPPGSGTATLYLMGPGHVEKREIKLGENVTIPGSSLRASGRYQVIVKNGGEQTVATLFVAPAKASEANFLARPSRVPVATSGVISGVAFVFDQYKNLVLAPTPVKFSLSVADAAPITRTETAKNGVAWVTLASAHKAGAAQFVAEVDDSQVRRVVQQVASDPCNLRMKAERRANGIEVETEPVRDCSGNPVPDGTIVTFTQVDAKGRSTVDARIKRGIAKAELPASDNATISVASGVVLGNEIHLGGGR
ncbi:MAG: hypothetical protein JO187_04530 [Acidobacteria bacterium]|nr:hypothetical protein [Acidobacteriota bacterium]